MNQSFTANAPFLFFPIFIGIWLVATTVLSVMSGWFALMRRFPDRPEIARITLRGQSGTMGIVNFNGILTLSACAGGLRVGVWRIFAPFSTPFFVPWDQITVTRGQRLFWKVATFNLGKVEGWQLTVGERIADRLAAGSPDVWPETHGFITKT